jgi:transcriptional regulator with XRE-family HTH domain
MADFARGELLIQLREGRHLSQEDAAHEVGVSVKSLRAWEHGGKIRWPNAKRVAGFYNVDPERLVSREEPDAETPELMDTLNGDMPEQELRAQLTEINDKLDAILTRLAVSASLPPEARPANTPGSATKATAASNTRAPRTRPSKP